MKRMNKTVLITGASRGIGAETARLFAETGYSVVINYCSSEKKAVELEEELTSAGYRAMALRADVSDEKQVDRMVKESLLRFGGIDVLVNNAGISRWGLIQQVPQEEWDRVFAVNVRGAFLCSRAVLPVMLREHRGKIINISSMWGISGASCEVLYSASKAAVIGLTRAMAQELGPSGIRVNCVAPGVIETDMTRGLGKKALEALRKETPLGALGTPRDVANSVLFLASEQADFITGQVISPNGGFLIG